MTASQSTDVKISPAKFYSENLGVLFIDFFSGLS